MALIKKHPDILRCCVTARDRSGSPALCVMSAEIKPPQHDVFLISEKKEKEDKAELNKLYVGIDKERKNLFYQVAIQTTFRGIETITVPIQASKLIPPLDLSKELTRETLKIYRSQLLKLAANRGHVDNKLYMQLTVDGNLNYTVLTPEGEHAEGTITQAELDKKIEAPLTLQILNALEGDILEITSKRGHTSLGRKATGTLLQLAVISGDIDLQKEIKNKEDHGLVEQLILMGELSQEEVTEQLGAVLSPKAQLNNEIRGHRIFTAIKKFGDAICKVNADGIMGLPDYYSKFRALQTRCQLLIDEFEEELQSDPDQVFDSSILHKAVAWFEKEETVTTKFGGWYSPQSNLFWITLGLLQCKLPTREKHIVNQGIGEVVDAHKIPPRTLNSAGGSSHFNSSRLGRDFYLGYSGRARVRALVGVVVAGRRGPRVFGNLMSVKNSSIAKLMQRPRRAPQSKCSIM